MSTLPAQIRNLIVTAPDRLRIDLQDLTAREAVTRAAAYRPAGDIADVTTATKTALRTMARQPLALNTDLKSLRDQPQALTEHANPTLLELPGVGPDTVAALLIAVGGNPERIPTSAAFAALCGVSPIAASSGKTHGCRLNRGRNRQANSALYRIVIVRMSREHPATIAHLEKRTQVGKSKRDTIGCLKRYVAREVFQAIKHSQPSTNRDQPLNAVAQIEKGIVHLPELTARYDQRLTQQEAA